MLNKRTSYLFFRRDASAGRPAAPASVPAGYRLSRWVQRGPLDVPPGQPWSWRHFAWWWLFRRADAPLRAIAVTDTDSGELVHITYIFPAYFRFPFMAAGDLQIGGIVTHPKHRNQGLAKAAIDEALQWLVDE